MDSFLQSCEIFEQYPRHLQHRDWLNHNLKSWFERLEQQKARLFNESKAAVDIYDYDSRQPVARKSCFKDLERLTSFLPKALSPGNGDPQCRFVFLQAPHSRAALLVSHAMFTFLFTYHQVMPAMLDFIFPFGKQIHAQDSYFGGFREESRLDVERRGPRITELGRSGIELRMCYNLRSVERSESDPQLKWSIRQSAMYHSFDLETGQSLWINVKGSDLIKERIDNTVTQPSSNSKAGAFSATLTTHLLFCDWSVENWRWYLNELEDRIQALAGNAVALDIEKPPSPPASPMTAKSPRMKPWGMPVPSRAGTMQSPMSGSTRWDYTPTAARSRSNTWNTGSQSRVAFDECPRRSTEPSDGDMLNMKKLKRRLSSLSAWNKSGTFWNFWKPEGDQEPISEEPKAMSTSSGERPKPPELPPSVDRGGDGGSQDKFTFSDLQCVQHIEDKAQEVLLVLKLNSEVLEQLREHYRYAIEHAEFPQQYRVDCKVDLARFNQRLLQVEKDYAMLYSRTETLLHLISNRKSLISGILQYRGVKANENFARKAEYSASRMQDLTEEMHDIAKKTEQETVSMRVITTVTLFFLPATFIATFMSTNILKFQDGQHGVHMNGLYLYLEIAMPLTALTFVAWFVFYQSTVKRRWPFRARVEDVEDGEKGVPFASPC